MTTDPAQLMRSDAQQRAQWTTEWLRSDDPRQIAWGAWLARQDRQKTVIPLLLEKVNGYQPQEESWAVERDRHDALLAVLDALIALNASVPADEVRKLYREFPAQSLILLVRTRDENAQSALLEIFGEAKANWNWLAAGNLLAKKELQDSQRFC